MDRSQFLDQFNREARRERSPQHRAARIKRDNASAKQAVTETIRLKRTRQLRANRKNLSIAQGLRKCRELRGISRDEFAQAMGITRRALYNYEAGLRSVPGELIEKIAKNGDLELHEILGTKFENPPTERRKSDATLAIRIYLNLKYEISEASDSQVSHISADDTDMQRLAADAAVSWSNTAKVTEKSIANVTKRLAEQLADDYALTDLANSWHLESG